VGVGGVGGSHRWRIGVVNHHEEFSTGSNEHPAEGVGFQWQDETAAQVNQTDANSQTVNWTPYQHHLPPYGALLYCQKS
jgi:hypothetical protein